MALKQFNVKHAERWLEKLKNQNLQSYKDITKFLRKYQKTQDQHDCYLKMSHTLLTHVQLTKEINSFLQDGNKFVVSRPDDQKLKDFMSYVKKNRPQVFNRIIAMIQELSRSKGEGNVDVSKLILPKLKQIVRGDLDLERLTDQALDMKDEELIKRKNLDHLRVVRPFVNVPEDAKDVAPSESQPLVKQPKSNLKQTKPVDISVIEREKKVIKQPQIVTFSNSTEEKTTFKQFRRSIDQPTQKYLMKILKIYTLNIITRSEALQLLNIPALNDQFFDFIRDILETRELDRRKKSIFKPLSDTNFSSYERPSPSYVCTPKTYPTKCSGKTAQIRSITSDKWISVPYGSQQNQNFSVRNKNTNEINLLKAQDERYEYHLYLKKLCKSKQLLDKYLDEKNGLDEYQREAAIRKFFNLGIIQIVYKNVKDDQKEQLQNFVKNFPKETFKVFQTKIENQITELKAIKDIHATKAWNEIAAKNFYKALDLKGFQFKKNQKEKLKNTFFISELNERTKLIENGGENKSNIRFEEKKEFFTVFNSFSSSSKTEKCNSRKFPAIQTFDLKDSKKRGYYPLMVLAFQDETTCRNLYSLVVYYIQTAQMTETQKYKAKLFLQQFLIGFLGWKIPTRKLLSAEFNQQALLEKINNMSLPFQASKCFTPQIEINLLRPPQQFDKSKGDKQAKQKPMHTLNDKQSKYSFLPKRSDEKQVLYCSDNVYCLVRYLYTLYQRFLKLKEIAQTPEHTLLFQLLFYSCIKTKQGIKFQQNLNALLGNHAYLFSTIYKIFDSLIKSIILSASCSMTSNSFKFADQCKCQDLYFILINRYCLANNLSNQKIIRLTYHKYDRVIYFNYLDCYYKAEDVTKDVGRKRVQIAKNVEIYTTDFVQYEPTKKRKVDEICYQSNQLQYVFEGTQIKMQNHNSNQDLLFRCDGGKFKNDNALQKQFKRALYLFKLTN